MSDKDEAGDAVAWRDGNVKTAVAVEEARVGAVQFDALLVNNKHGDLGAILGGIEDLGGADKDTTSGHKQLWNQSQDVSGHRREQ